MKDTFKTVAQIKEAFYNYHASAGFQNYPSFPVTTDDPTVLFVNASMTPFKSAYLNGGYRNNYAIVQNCLRMGGAADMNLVGLNPYYHTFFEMYGSGIFTQDYYSACQMMISLLVDLGL
ncbi:MAG: alanine--tRNA ligase-related protein, partial [Pseudomonadota bacterium]